jgi:hypothetical protein
MIDQNLEYLLTEFRDRIQMLHEAAGNGQCASYEEYKYTCGQVRGLEAACMIITDLANRMEKSDD